MPTPRQKIRDTPKGVRISFGLGPNSEPTFLYIMEYRRKADDTPIFGFVLGQLTYNERTNRFSVDFAEKPVVWLEPYELERLGKRFVEMANKVKEIGF